MYYYLYVQILIIKVKKTDDFSIRSIRSVNIADGLVSTLALQTALLAESDEVNSGL